MTITDLFFRFEGRINRTQFWLAGALLLMLELALLYLLCLLNNVSFYDHITTLTPQTLLFGALTMGLLTWPNLAVGYKRLQ